MKVDVVSHFPKNDKGFEAEPTLKRVYIDHKFVKEFKDPVGRFEEVKVFIRQLFKKQAIDVRYINKADQ